MTDDLAKKINQIKKQVNGAKALKQATDSSPPKKDKSHLKGFTTPGMAQAQVMARIGGVHNDSESLVVIIDGLFDRLNSANEQEIELTLHGQIAMLNTLGAHFMKKAITAYDSPEILETLPQIPSELASLSLKCQTEMRRCIELLNELKNPRKPSQFIKTYVNNQLNQLQTRQEEIEQQLEASKYAQMDTRSKGEAIADDPELEAVEQFNGTSDG